MMIAVICLSIALVVCIAFIFLLKRDISILSQSLNIIKKCDSNSKLTTETFDKNICELCDSINDMLEKQKQSSIASETSNREFRQAITNISHDLRTPITSAIGYIQMMKTDKISQEKKIEYLNIIEYRLKSLSGLMNELFEYTQIVEGKTSNYIEKVNICNMLRDIISSFYDEFIEKKFTVEIKIPELPVYVFCDVDLFKRVIQNLIQNVLVHGNEHFELVVDSKNNTIIFKNKVSNIREIDVACLFHRFYTADMSRSGKTTGLGLAISKQLVENMSGNISANLEEDMLCIYLKF